MSEHARTLALTKVAFLNAVIFSLLSIQFALPPAFVVLLCIVPAIFALQAYHVPMKLVSLSGLLAIVASSVAFGIIVGVWTCIYFVAGTSLGVGRRYHMPFAFRLLTTTVAFILMLVVGTIAFAGLADVNMRDVNALISRSPLLTRVAILPILATGVVFLSLLASWGADRFLARLLSHLEVGVQ